MPTFSETEIEARVRSGEISAVTLDTSIFDRFNRRLESAALLALEQFKDSRVKVVLTDVTLGEVRSHIAKEASEKAEKARAGINQFKRTWGSNFDLETVLTDLGVNADPEQHAASQVQAFVERVGVEIVGPDPASLPEIMRRYFTAEPPFSRAETKKHEFPDAVTLLALERWAEHNACLVLAISADGDWAEYAAQSPRIVCIDDLGRGLSFFNRDARVVANRIGLLIKAGSGSSVAEAVERAIVNHIEFFTVEASSAFYYDESDVYSSLLGWDVIDPTFDVLESDNETVIFSFTAEVEADFSADFSFSVRDGIDRDYIPMGSCTATRTEQFSLDIVIIAHLGDEFEEEPEHVEVEIEGRNLTVDFGEIEPDWDHDD